MSRENPEVKKQNKNYKNWASDKEFADEVVSKLTNQWNKLKADREKMRLNWLRYYDMWSVTHNSEQSYLGRANLYWPQIRKEIETMTRRLQKALFPDDYLSAEAENFENDIDTEANKYIVKHYYDNVIGLKNLSEPWLKSMCIYGTSPAKVYWETKKVTQFYKTKEMKKTKQGSFEPSVKTVKEEVCLYNAPKFEPKDIFQVWVAPTTASNPRDLKQVFELQKVTLQQLKQKEAEGACTTKRLKELEEQGKESDREFEDRQIRQSVKGSSGMVFEDDKVFDLLEIWTELDLPDGTRVPCVVEIVNNAIPIRIQQNPFWHQRPPYVFARFIKAPTGEFYGRGLPEAVEHLQYQLNDTANQTVDSATLSLNNVVIVNPAFAPNVDSFEFEPSAIWWADPNAVKQMDFPDLSATGMRNALQLKQVISEMSDNVPMLPDPIAGKARSTGQATMAIEEWQTDLYSFVEKIEGEALVPATQQIHSLLQQFVDEDVIVRIGGKYAGTWLKRIITPEELVGNYLFRWKGAIQTENAAIKAQQLLNFMKVASSIPQQETKLNWPNFLTMLLRDGFQHKNPSELIETQDLSPSVPAGIENKILRLKGNVKVKMQDDDEIHLNVHKDGRSKEKDEYCQYLFDLHIAGHEGQLAAKRDAARMIQQQLAAQQAQNQPKPGQRTSPGVNNPMGNQTQINQSTNEADMMKGQRLG